MYVFLQYTINVYWASHAKVMGSVWAPRSGVMVFRTVLMVKMSLSAVRHQHSNLPHIQYESTFVHHISEQHSGLMVVLFSLLHSSFPRDQLNARKLLVWQPDVASSVCWKLEQWLRKSCVWGHGLQQVLIFFFSIVHVPPSVEFYLFAVKNVHTYNITSEFLQARAHIAAVILQKKSLWNNTAIFIRC